MTICLIKAVVYKCTVELSLSKVLGACGLIYLVTVESFNFVGVNFRALWIFCLFVGMQFRG